MWHAAFVTPDDGGVILDSVFICGLSPPPVKTWQMVGDAVFTRLQLPQHKNNNKTILVVE